MSAPDAFDRMLGALHEAALDDAHWPAAAGLIDQACGSRGSVLVYGNGASGADVDIFFARVCFGGKRHPECESDYFRRYHGHDERLPRIRQLPDGEIVSNAELLTDAERRTSVVYNEMVRPSEFEHGLYARLDGPAGSRIVWTAANPVTGDDWSSAQVETLARVLPHLRQYVRVRQALAGARALGGTFSDLLANLQVGVIQLDRRGHVLAANDRARAMLRTGDGVTDRDGTLRAALSREDAELQRVLARALPASGQAGAAGSVAVSREHALVRLMLYVSPVRGNGAEPHAGRIAAIVLAVDPTGRPNASPDRLQALFGLTAAEGLIAARLAEGKTIREIAAATRRSETTVKWHVQHLFNKLGVSRQVDLVRLVLSVADLPEDLH